MNASEEMVRFRSKVQEEYRVSLGLPIHDEFFDHTLPFWLSIAHPEDGASVGLVDEDLNIHPDSPRSLVYTARMLWSFASLALAGFPELALSRGSREYEVLRKDFLDTEEDGYYYMTKPGGKVIEDTKLVYAQGFVLYALAAWYRASGNEQVLDDAKHLFELIESRCRRTISGTQVYGEAYTRSFALHDDNVVADGVYGCEVTMNTTLHMLEAYTALYEAWPDPKLRRALLELLAFTLDNVYDPVNGQLHVYLDKDLQPIGEVWSLGHDIEAAWLVEHTADVLASKGDLNGSEATLISRTHAMCRRLEDTVLPRAIEEVTLPNGMIGVWHANDIRDGITDRTRIWWVQAEAVNALINAGLRRGDEYYLQLAVRLWASIEAYMIDHRVGGEWHSELDIMNEPEELPVADPWKGLYHNGRMFLNVITLFGAC